jgi:hypothetical protein
MTSVFSALIAAILHFIPYFLPLFPPGKRAIAYCAGFGRQMGFAVHYIINIR